MLNSSIKTVLAAIIVTAVFQNPALADPPKAPHTLRPRGEVASVRPWFTWRQVKGSLFYDLEVRNDRKRVLNKRLNSARYCRNGLCRYRPARNLARVAHAWRIRGENRSGKGKWSRPLAFKVKPQVKPDGFFSDFNRNHQGWDILGGTWRIVKPGYLSLTKAAKHDFSLACQQRTWRDFEFSARMMAKGDNPLTTGVSLHFRAGNALGLYDWSGYIFSVLQKKKMAMIMRNPGFQSIEPLGGEGSVLFFKHCPQIRTDGFNTLKVRAIGHKVDYYINGHHVYTTNQPSPKSHDDTLLTGKVGVTSLSRMTPAFYCDWARLAKIR